MLLLFLLFLVLLILSPMTHPLQIWSCWYQGSIPDNIYYVELNFELLSSIRVNRSAQQSEIRPNLCRQ